MFSNVGQFIKKVGADLNVGELLNDNLADSATQTLLQELTAARAKVEQMKKEIQDLRTNQSINNPAICNLSTADTLAPLVTDDAILENSRNTLFLTSQDIVKSIPALDSSDIELIAKIALLENTIVQLNEQIKFRDEEDMKRQAPLDDGPAALRESTDLKKAHLALEQKHFSLNEQVQDLKIQVANKQAEASSQYLLAAAKSTELDKIRIEHEEKVKKLKGILSAANKNISENKDRIANTEGELALVNIKLCTNQERNLKHKAEVSEQDRLIHTLRSEILDLQVNGLSNKLQASQYQSGYNDLSLEFASYKVKAHAALSQLSLNETQDCIRQLEEMIQKLNLENREKSLLLENLNIDHTLLIKESHDCELEIDALTAQLESARIDCEKAGIYRQEIELLNNRVAEDEQSYNHKILEIGCQHNSAIVFLSDQMQNSTGQFDEQLKQRDEEILNLKKTLEKRRNFEVLRYSSELNRLQDELIEAKAVAINASREIDRRISVTSPIARPSLAIESPTMTTFKEKEYLLNIQHLSHILNESDANATRLLEQEKEELRKLERVEKRQDLSVEYLKNVVLMFLEADVDTREPLLAVVVQVLQLSPEEVHRLRKSAVGDTPPQGLLEGWFT